jgi:cytochrome b6-f complex iron-sulfur subunit
LSLDLNSNPTLNSSGGSVFKQSANIIVVNVNNTLIAVTSICTHQACNVAYMSNSNNFQCPCHGSEYDINGNVIQGPATMPLQKYSTAVVGNTLYVY